MPHLTRENREALLERASHRSKRQVEEQIAEIAPRPDVPAMVRKLPERRTLEGVVQALAPVPTLELRPDGVAASEMKARQDPPAAPPVVQPLSPGRYKVQFTASAELQQKLERLQALMDSKGRDGDLAAVIEQAVTEKLERLEASRLTRTKAPRKGPAEKEETQTSTSPSSRHIPAAVQRAVRERDGDRCRYVDDHGRRCKEHNHLQFHHRHPFGLGGEHSVGNVRLMCRAHNAYLAECDYGREAMARHRRTSRVSQPTAG